jgi:hypothetical protein
MKLKSVQISCPQTLGDVKVSFADDEGNARPVTLLFGGPGSGKTTLLSAIAHTRPGHTVAMAQRPSEPPCTARCEWWLALDEPDRAHPLLLWSPNAAPEFMSPSADARREAMFFDRLAREGGFVFSCFSATRWFSRSAMILTAPERTVRRYDVRNNDPLDDASRNDLTREVKQALTYAAIVRVLPDASAERHRQLGDAMGKLVASLSAVFGFAYSGLDPASLEPMFTSPQGAYVPFDGLPTAVKHAVAFGALTLRALWAAYPGLNPELAQGFVAIDQLELHQDAAVASTLIDRLSSALPHVQWLITTRSTELLTTRNPEECIALRRLDAQGTVSVHQGRDAHVH